MKPFAVIGTAVLFCLVGSAAPLYAQQGHEQAKPEQKQEHTQQQPRTPVSYTHLDVYKRQGVGSLTALAFVLIIGKADRFQCGKQIASYLGPVSYTHL